MTLAEHQTYPFPVNDAAGGFVVARACDTCRHAGHRWVFTNDDQHAEHAQRAEA